MPENTLFDVIIIGSGPAGLTAAIYTTRANLKTAIVAGRTWGGQLMLTTLVENYPGFPEGIQGPDLMMNMRKQAEHHGAEIFDVNFKEANFQKVPFEVTTDDEKKLSAKSVIIATGADTKWLDVPGEKERIGRGVSSCAPCDGAFFRNKRVIVVGGGDSAMEEALVLTKFATEVRLLHRRKELKASEIMQQRVLENPKIKVFVDIEIEEIIGDQKVEKVKLRTTSEDNKVSIKQVDRLVPVSEKELGGAVKGEDGRLHWEWPIDGIFVAVGHMPNSKIFKGIEVDEKGFVKIFNHTKTNIDGVFVAGDVHDPMYKQAVTAAGFGCMAALEVEKWLENRD